MRKGLNRHTVGLVNGERVGFVELMRFDGVRRDVGDVRAFWPFVVFRCSHGWNVTHGPTGYHVLDVKTLTAARDLVAGLQRVADWHFTSVRGTKCARAKRAATEANLIAPLVRIA